METNSIAETTFPDIIPCCYGKEVGVEPEIISTGLSAISIKRDKKNKADQHQLRAQKKNFENRNSFFNLHRPELTKINWMSTSPRKIEHFFHDHATTHGQFCAYLHNAPPDDNDDLRCLLPANEYKHDEEEFYGLSGSMGNSVLLKSCSIQLSDEDLSPSNICHRSRAEFCVTMGGKEVPRYSRSMSQPNAETLKLGVVDQGPRKGSLPKEHEYALSGLKQPERVGTQRVTLAPSSKLAPTNSSQKLGFLSTMGASTEVATLTAKSPRPMTESSEVLLTVSAVAGRSTELRTTMPKQGASKELPTISDDDETIALMDDGSVKSILGPRETRESSHEFNAEDMQNWNRSISRPTARGEES